MSQHHQQAAVLRTPEDVPEAQAAVIAYPQRSILIVDDDPCILGLLRLHLQNAGYRVHIAEDAVVAGRLLLKAAPDVMIVDINMPYMDGLEFVQAVKTEQRLAHIPVIFLTSNTDAKQRAMALGAVAFLTKPVRADQLLAAVAKQIPDGRIAIG
jgi:CheY-like chemotaxis protein